MIKPIHKPSSALARRLKHINKKDILTRILAGAGAVLVWFPVMASILVSLYTFINTHWFPFDYLMPAEFFPFAFAGGGLLVWAALRVHSRQRHIGWGLGIAASVLVSGQVLAVVTGLASGKTMPVGLWWLLVLTSLVIYSMALVALGVGGVLLLGDLSRIHHSRTQGL